MEGLHIGDAREFAARLPARSVQTIVTSPPYWGLRSYLPADDTAKPLELGSEATPGEFAANLVAVFAALRPALRDDGTLWLNLGDSYAGNQGGPQGATGDRHDRTFTASHRVNRRADGLKDKDLVGIPWLVAFALRADGWYLRSDIIWHKPNPMPESVRDRPTRAHEYLFLLTKQSRYYYDADAIREPHSDPKVVGGRFTGLGGVNKQEWEARQKDGAGRESFAMNDREYNPLGRNKRDVWTFPSAPFPGSHFATFPPELVRPCIRAGSSQHGACAACGAPWRRVTERPAAPDSLRNRGGGSKMDFHTRQVGGGQKLQDWYDANPVQTTGWQPSCQCGTTETIPCLVLDPFLGSGTVAAVAIEEGRRWVGCDLDARNAALVAGRINGRQVRLSG